MFFWASTLLKPVIHLNLVPKNHFHILILSMVLKSLSQTQLVLMIPNLMMNKCSKILLPIFKMIFKVKLTIFFFFKNSANVSQETCFETFICFSHHLLEQFPNIISKLFLHMPKVHQNI